ncbi:hypothetical protein [Rhizobium leguminosarum]|uniref:hypothetical protein n=1 Tax=Rhizobium leguminosarum TaxID=384 RepID=UPI001D9E768B|nr:hypothetical protein [Rhizobium leguminosarum]
MLKLPAVRGQLQLLATRDDPVQGLCEAYEDASAALDGFRSRERRDFAVISEYETICAEIESDVIRLCLEARHS